MPDDTSREAAAVQMALLRNATTGVRAAAMRSLSTTTIDLSRRALKDTMPDATKEEVLVRWVALHYGEHLASGVAARLGLAAS